MTVLGLFATLSILNRYILPLDHPPIFPKPVFILPHHSNITIGVKPLGSYFDGTILMFAPLLEVVFSSDSIKFGSISWSS